MLCKWDKSSVNIKGTLNAINDVLSYDKNC